MASFVILGTAALMILSALRIDLAPLLASAGVAGVAIGFGARNLVTDFLSGVFMIMEDQYGVGDSIDAGVASGEVIEVGLRVTKLRGDQGEIWYVRNGEIKRIGNLSQGWATAAVDVQVKPTEDLDRLREIIGKVAEDLAKVGAVERAPLGPGRGAGPGLGSAGLDGAAGLGQDDAGQGAGRGARAALAPQARPGRSRHPYHGRPGRSGRRGTAGRRRGLGGRALGPGQPGLPAVRHGIADLPAGSLEVARLLPPLLHA